MKPLLVSAAAAATAVLTACGTQPAAESGGLPPLQLTDSGVVAQAAIAPNTVDGNNGFQLRTALPVSTPAPAPVWRLPHASAASAGQVAGALGLRGTPTAIAGGWVLRAAGQLLAVHTDGSWTWAMDCSPDTPVQQERLDVMCASATGGGVAVAPAAGGPATTGTNLPPVPPPTPPPVPRGPNAAAAEDLAAPMLSRLGWADATVDVRVGAPTTTVTARRRVDGTPTADWFTTLDFRRSGTLVSGSGYVGAPTRGRSYPLISADRAFRGLLAEPRAMPEICQVRKDGKPGCAPIPPTVITGSALGLALRHDLGRPLLVPAWLFTVQGSAQPLAVVAVDPRYLKPPVTAVPLPLAPAPANPAGPATKPS